MCPSLSCCHQDLWVGFLLSSSTTGCWQTTSWWVLKVWPTWCPLPKGRAEVWRRIWHWMFPRVSLLLLPCHLPPPKGAQGVEGLDNTGWGIWQWVPITIFALGPLKPVGTMKFHQAMFLSCKQGLKTMSLRWGLHNTFLTRPFGALQNVSTNSQSFIQLRREECGNFLENVLFCLELYTSCHFLQLKLRADCQDLGLYVSVQSEFQTDLWSSEFTAYPFCSPGYISAP